MDYWESRRGERSMPSRADIDPIDIPSLLSGILLIEIDPETGRMKFRLTGTRITTMYGEDYTGRYLDDTFFGRRRDDVVASYEHVARTGEPHHSRMAFTNRDGLEFDMERLILPLSTDGRTVDRMIAYLDIQTPKAV